MRIRILSSILAITATALSIAACSTTENPNAPAPAGATPPASLPTSTVPAPATARYRVTFQATWSGGTHPVDFPSSANLSPLVGGTHNTSVTFWSEGALASTGIKDMSERGRTTPLDQEVGAAIANGAAEYLLLGGGIGTSPGSVSLEFQMSQTYPLVTLVSMVAPSPDWFVGVSRLPLFENSGWVDERRIELVPWDAGTDSGVTFTSPDLVTTPAQPISRIVTTPLSPGGRVTPLGTFTFTRLPS